MSREVTRRAVLLAGALFSVAATARHKQQRRATVRVGDVRACAVEGGFTWDGSQWIGD